MMLTSIHIEGFKNFKDTKIESLRKVNLILGGQNVGKTSLLEAVWLGTAHKDDIDKLSSIFRRIENPKDLQYFFDTVFNQNSIGSIRICTSNITIATHTNKYEIERVKNNLKNGYNITPRGEFVDALGMILPLDHIYKNNIIRVNNHEFCREFDFDYFVKCLSISTTSLPDYEVVNLFGKVFEKRKKKILIALLKKVEPRLEDINTGNINGEWRIYLDMNGQSRSLPISHLGHGFSRLFHLYCSLLETDAKVALIDEIENGVYYAALPTIFQGIQDLALTQGIQSLITTHSWECICAAYNVFAEAGRLEDFQLIRLEQEGDNVRAVLINDEDLDTIMEAGHEIR